MDREGGNKEKMRKCREYLSLHFLILSPFPLHFLIFSLFSRIKDARMQQVATLINDIMIYNDIMLGILEANKTNRT